jgi:hypothetical protein
VAPRGRHLIVLGALTALAAALRFATLGLQSLDYDEAYTAGVVIPGSFGHMWSLLPKTESSPPLHYVLEWAWTRPFGLGEVSVRFISALAGTAVVPVVYAAGRRLGSARAGLVAAALVAVNPFLVWYSQEARAYSLLTLLGALSFLAFAAALRDPSPRRLALWAGVCALALWTHYFAVFLVAAEAAWLLWRSPARRRVAIAIAAVAAAGTAVLPLALDQADGRTDWITGQGLPARVAGVISKFLLGEVDPVGNAVLVLAAGALAGLAVWCALRLPDRSGLAVAAGVAAAAVALPLALEPAGLHYLIARNVIAALPVAAVAGGLALSRGPAGTVGAALLCALSLAIVLAGALDHRLQRPDYGGAARALAPVGLGQAVVTPFLGSTPVEYYLPGSAAGQANVDSFTVVQALRRRDAGGPSRDPVPPAPPGFRLASRIDRPSYSLTRYRAPAPTAVSLGAAQAQIPGGPGREPLVLVWPHGSDGR